MREDEAKGGDSETGMKLFVTVITGHQAVKEADVCLHALFSGGACRALVIMAELHSGTLSMKT